MALRLTLLQIATLLSAAACSSSANVDDTTSHSGTDGGADGAVPPVGCGGCNCGAPATTQANATAAQACALAAEPGNGSIACGRFCGALPGNKTGTSFYCQLPAEYTTAYRSAQADGGVADAGPAHDAGSSDAGSTCPAWSGDIVVQCGYLCLGRRTAGISDPTPGDGALGALFAERAYLEAVSVHAFARLERELVHHRAPTALVRAAGRARRDEIRHTAMTLRLARRFGGDQALPGKPCPQPPRSLVEIATENAVEGCVRETYGTVIGLLEANLSSDRDVRRAARAIAADECRHAELAMEVAHWVDRFLTPSERETVRAGVAGAIAHLRAHADAAIVELLEARVWNSAPFAAVA